jgi:hypothetical protein
MFETKGSVIGIRHGSCQMSRRRDGIDKVQRTWVLYIDGFWNDRIGGSEIDRRCGGEEA